MNKAAFFKELEGILEAPAGSVKEGAVLKEVGTWDSMSILSFIAFADEQLGLEVVAEDLAACVTAEHLVALCAAKIDG